MVKLVPFLQVYDVFRVELKPLIMLLLPEVSTLENLKGKLIFFFLFRLSCLYARNDAERKPTVLLLNGNGSPAVEC